MHFLNLFIFSFFTFTVSRPRAHVDVLLDVLCTSHISEFRIMGNFFGFQLDVTSYPFNLIFDLVC